MFHIKQKAFTLVELIVVVTILAILATIGFVSYSSYLVGTRDTNRLAQLVSISDGLDLYSTKKLLPIPDDKVSIIANTSTIAYQGYVGSSTLETIDFTKGGKDPKDDSFFSYYLTADRKSFQLLAFLEEEQNFGFQITPKLLNNDIHAIDYINRYPVSYGRELGILLDYNDNTPIQEKGEDINLYNSHSGALFKAIMTDDHFMDRRGIELIGALQHVARNNNFGAPTECDEGFVAVSGNYSIGQPGFCVSKYEMTREDTSGSPDSTGASSTWNSYSYNGEPIASQPGYPISVGSVIDPVVACKSLGSSYHLLTDDEWMTIARSIESNEKNRNAGALYRGNSGDTSGALGCRETTGPRARATMTGTGTDAMCNIKRVHFLQNGDEIWDFAGNLVELVDKTNVVKGERVDNRENTIFQTAGYTQWSDSGISEYDRTHYGPLDTGHNSNQGVGMIYNDADGGHFFLRGGAESFTTASGIFTTFLHEGTGTELPGNDSSWAGFRCAK